MRSTRSRHLTRGATSLDAALAGAGPEVATPPLARLGRQLQAADLGPRDSFRADLRSQLLSGARVTAPAALRRPQTVTAPARPVSWFLTRLTAGIAAGGVMVAGVGVASARALPGDALYGVKRDTEAVQLDLAHGDSARGLLHLQFATSRLSEVHSLLSRAGLTSPAAEKHETPAVVSQSLAATLRSTLSAMDADTASGATELTQSFLHKRQEASLTKLAAFTAQQETALTSVLPALPAPEAAASLHVLHAVAAQTTALLAEPASPPPALPAATPSTSPSTPPSADPSSPTASPSAKPSPSATDTPISAPSATPSGSPSATPSTSSPSPTDEPKSPSETPTTSPTPAASASPTPEPSTKPSTSPSATASPAPPSPSATVTP